MLVRLLMSIYIENNRSIKIKVSDFRIKIFLYDKIVGMSKNIYYL